MKNIFYAILYYIVVQVTNNKRNVEVKQTGDLCSQFRLARVDYPQITLLEANSATVEISKENFTGYIPNKSLWRNKIGDMRRCLYL